MGEPTDTPTALAAGAGTAAGTDTGAGPAAPRRRRRVVRAVLIAVGALVVVVAAVLMVFLRRQTVSYLTHWKGPPQQSVPYAALPGTPELHIDAVGDAGDSGPRVDSVAAALEKVNEGQPVDVLLLLGDNVYPSGDASRIPATVFEPFAPVLANAELDAIIGNHDVMGGNGEKQVDALGMPGRYWAKDYGDTLLVGLDTNNLDDGQLAWLEETLAASTARWKIVAMHHPPYSAGYQGSSLDVRNQVAPIFEREGVQLVLSGHDHDYQRSIPVNGVTYIVTGSGSGTRRTGAADFTAESFAWLGFVDIGVYPDRLVVRSLSEDLEMTDEVEIAPDGAVTELGP